MTKQSFKWFAIAALSLPCAVLPSMAHAQSIAPPRANSVIDERGVDLSTGAFHVSTPAISVGQPGFGGLSFARTWDSSVQDWRDNYVGTIFLDTSVSPATYTVTVLGSSSVFTLVSGVFVQKEVRGETLTFNSGTNKYTFITASGATAMFDKALASTQPTKANEGRIVSLADPSGETLSFTYTTLTGTGFLAHRLQSVNNNLGYQIKFEYASSLADATGLTLTKATAINNAIDYCSPTTNTACSFTATWPSLTFAASGATQTVTDALSRTTTYTLTSGVLTGIRRPTSATDNWTIGYTSGQVATVNDGAGTWTYNYSGDATTRINTISFPSGGQRLISVENATGLVTLDNDSANRTSTYEYDPTTHLLSRITGPGGNKVEYTYDARGNVTLARQVAKAGSGLADITTSAVYPAACSNRVTCNLPTSSTDERGFVTDYTYNTTHGGALTITAPAPATGGIRPQTRYTYVSVSAKAKNSAGTLVTQTPAVFRVGTISSCATLATCANGADETRTTVAYVTNNLLPSSATTAAGNGVLSAVSTPAFDAVGNLSTVDGPLSGTADISKQRFDAMRQRVGVIGPDPDGAGALKNRAQRITYNADGQPVTIAQGTVNSQSDPDWAAFATLDSATIAYDGVGRRIKDTYVGSGGTQAVTQYGYDTTSRLECTAVRMNPAVFGSLPSDACALGTTGANGADRITRTIYDPIGRVTSVKSAVGTALEQTTAATTYISFPFPNTGLPLTLADANGNVTTFEYDGFQRLSKTSYPSPTSTGSSSATDYEQNTYDAASNVTTLRRRDGATIVTAFDNLNRPTSATSATAPTITTTYDNFGRAKTVAASGQTLTYSYDQLGRQTSVAGASGTVAYQYDLAGRRTRMTWPDAFYVTYDVDLTNAVTAIRENGAASGVGVLATYAYDDLGRRTSLTRGNGVVSSWSYDAASRLSSLTNNLAGTASDQTLSFGYNAASQALTRTATNSAYAFVPTSVGKAYAKNGLNQYTSVAGAAFSYDGRGNLTGDGVKTFGYDAYNRLTSASGGATFGYDPVGRLRQAVLGATTTNFDYDGVDLIGERNGAGTLLRRYVHGPASDEPLVWYEGAGTTDRRWMIPDQLGSIIAVTDASGAALTINTFDEFGTPGASNAGRFQYTGQTWLPGEAGTGLYYYKARFYSPGLGRFLQTDPILWDGGMNLYAYAENDGVNAIDPLGFQDSPPAAKPPIVVPAHRDGGSLLVGGTRSFQPGDSYVDYFISRAFPSVQCANSDTVCVTARRRPRSTIQAPPAIPQPLPSHRYTLSARLTFSDTSCTLAQVSGAVNRNIVPGNYGTHIDGINYRVFAPGGSFSPGTIRFTSNLFGTQFSNVTNSDHILRYGRVDTTISGGAKDGYSAIIDGYGTNTSESIAAANQYGGPGIFSSQLDAASEELEGICR